MIPFLPAPSRLILNCNLPQVQNEISDELLFFFPSSFKLNTQISMPHDDHITAMCFRDMDELEDDSLILVTAGKDCLFKVWVILEDTDPEGKHGQSVTWSYLPPYNML